MKHLKHLDDEHTKSLYAPSVPILFPHQQNSVSENMFKMVYPTFQRKHRQPAASKLTRNKKNHVLKHGNGIHALSLKRTTWKQRRSLLSSQKGLLLIKTISSFVINHLTWDRIVRCSTPFCLQQQQQQPNYCYKTKTTPIPKPDQTPTYQKKTVNKETNQHLISKDTTLLSKILESPRLNNQFSAQ